MRCGYAASPLTRHCSGRVLAWIVILAHRNYRRSVQAIPVFLSGEGVHVSGQWTRGAYVPPYSDVIRWPELSLHVAGGQLGGAFRDEKWGDHAHRLLDILAAVPDEQVVKMQRKVRHAWHEYLRPERVGGTLWSLLRRRASFFDAPYDVQHSSIGLHITEKDQKAYDAGGGGNVSKY